MNYAPVIGLEVHLQLKTQSKIFCGCSTHFGAPPNSQVCPVCLGFPGVLPVLNRQVLLYGIRVALSLNCRMSPSVVFHRKNYFYPDLPKDFQISQYDLPLGVEGFVELASGRKIRICRVHMEEDAGKLIHKETEAMSLVDYNRAGVPLLEIVSEPDLVSPEEAYDYLKTLKGILEYLEVSDCDMEKGSLRCDANISLRSVSTEVPGTISKQVPGTSEQPMPLGTKVEIKNLNSFKAVSKSLAYEVKRQSQALEAKEKLQQETRSWDDLQGITLSMRSKEYAHDYRYFPEPDLVPFSVEPQEVEAAQKALPELPKAKGDRFARQYQLPAYDAAVLTSSRPTADYFEECVKSAPGASKALANWILGDLAREVNDRNLESIQRLEFPPSHLGELVKLIDTGTLSGKMAKEVLVEAVQSHRSPAEVVKAQGLAQVTDSSVLREAASAILNEQAQAVDDYRKGKSQALMFLVGQLMRRTQGAASPAVAQEVFKELLEKRG